MNNQGLRPRRSSKTSVATACAVALAIFGGGSFALGAGDDDSAPPGRSIGYVINDIHWAVYKSKDGKEECPQGVAELGPREQYKLRFPDDGTKRTVVDSSLAYERDNWWPNTAPDPFPFREASGTIAIGLNLDGKTKPTDFTSPDGEAGVDNQLYRVIGCIGNYRSGGSLLTEESGAFQREMFDRMLIELTDVDSLVNDNDVTVTTYRGRDKFIYDAQGKHQPGGTQRLELLWGKTLIRHVKGKIVDGVLITEPMEFVMPSNTRGGANYEKMNEARFKLKLTPERAEGVIGGYVDVENFFNGRNRNYSTQHQSYGRQAAQSVYKVLHKYADALPDPKTGENTAISAAYTVKLVQVHILHSDKEVAQDLVAPVARQFANSGSASPAAEAK